MNKLHRKALLFVMALLISAGLFSQSNTWAAWHIINTKVHFGKKWNLFFEAQTRSQTLTKSFFYHELKTGVAYNLSDKIGALLGTGQFVTYSPDGNFKPPVQSTEFRVWEQLQLYSKLNRLKFEHRYRIEQRFLSTGFRNRFRYRLNATLPVNKAEVTRHTFFVAANDEIFIGDTNPFFERNRFYAGTGYEFNRNFTVQAGWLRQFDLRKDRTTIYRDFVQTTFLFDIFYTQHHKTNHPEISN